MGPPHLALGATHDTSNTSICHRPVQIQGRRLMPLLGGGWCHLAEAHLWDMRHCFSLLWNMLSDITVSDPDKSEVRWGLSLHSCSSSPMPSSCLLRLPSNSTWSRILLCSPGISWHSPCHRTCLFYVPLPPNSITCLEAAVERAVNWKVTCPCVHQCKPELTGLRWAGLSPDDSQLVRFSHLHNAGKWFGPKIKPYSVTIIIIPKLNLS